MNWKKIKMVAEILKALQPIIWEIVDDIMDAADEESAGGQQITKEERQKIIFDNLLNLPEVIEKIIKNRKIKEKKKILNKKIKLSMKKKINHVD